MSIDPKTHLLLHSSSLRRSQQTRLNSDDASRRSSIRWCHIRQRRTRRKQPIPKSKTLVMPRLVFEKVKPFKFPYSPDFHSKLSIPPFCFTLYTKKASILFFFFFLLKLMESLVNSYDSSLIGLDCAECGAVYFDVWRNCASIAHGSGRGWGG